MYQFKREHKNFKEETLDETCTQYTIQVVTWTQNKMKANMKLKRSDNSFKRYLTKVYEKLNKHKAFKIVDKAWNELFKKKTYRKEHECMNCKQSKCIENNYKKKC